MNFLHEEKKETTRYRYESRSYRGFVAADPVALIVSVDIVCTGLGNGKTELRNFDEIDQDFVKVSGNPTVGPTYALIVSEIG